MWPLVILAMLAAFGSGSTSSPSSAAVLDHGTYRGVRWEIRQAGDAVTAWVWSLEDGAWAVLDHAHGTVSEVRATLQEFLRWYAGERDEVSGVVQLQRELDLAGVEHFSAAELTRINHPAIARDVGITTPWFDPPPAVRAELVGAALLAERVRERYGGPIQVVNGYRPPPYDARVTTAEDSRHRYGQAIDGRGDDPARLRAAVWGLVQEGVIHGAGFYEGSVHFDTRPPPGHLWGPRLADFK